MKIRIMCIALIALVGLAAGVWAADVQPIRAVALRASQAPVLDGKLNDKVWSKAPDLPGFVLLNTFGQPAAQTHVKVLIEGTTLYVGFRCIEPEMDKLVATKTERDSAVWTDDSVEIIIDPMNGRQTIYHLIMSAAGGQYDARMSGDSASEDPAWNGDWRAATSKGRDEWFAEVMIPYGALGIQPNGSPCMGINFARNRLPGSQELSTWVPTVDNFPNPGCLGELVVPNPDSSYITVDMKLPDTLFAGKQTTGFVITNRGRKKIDLRFVYEVTGTASMVGNTEYATVHPSMKGVGSFDLNMGGPGDFRLTTRVEDKEGHILYSSGKSFKVAPPVGIDERLYQLYRNKAEASISLNVSAEQTKISTLKVSLLAPGAAAPVEVKTLEPPLTSPTVVSFDLTGKPAASYAIRAELMQGDKRIAAGQSTHMPYKPSTPVGLDANGFLTVDGKPYFPVGMYTLQDKDGKDHDSILKEAHDAGFNTTVFYAYTLDTVTPLLDAAQRNGIKAFVYPTAPFSVAGVDATLANAAKDVAARVNHPAVLGWYIVDEPEGIGKGAVDKTRELYQIVKEADPTHPCSLVIMSPGAAAKYRACTDIMWIDPYPVPHQPVTYVSDCVGGAVKNVEKDKPVWAIPQAFDWAMWNTGKIGAVHRPTDPEERCMTYLALVHGAKGVIYWAHTASKYYIRDYPEHWEYMKKLAGEMRDLSPVLLTPDVARVVGLEPKDAPIDTMVKRLNGQTYVFAVNHENKACKATLTLPNSTASGSADVLFEGRTVAAANGSWQDDFKPLEVHVYRVEE